MIRLSVAIPAYNQGRYLREALHSVLNQSIQPYEVVVSDNHSTDETPRILEEFSNRIRIVRPPMHLPMMAHWNFLAAELKGDWFALLSSDDRAKRDFVEVLHGLAGRARDAVLARAGWRDINGSGEIISRHVLLSVKNISRPPATLYEQLQGPKASFGGCAVKVSAWRRTGGYPEECQLYGDWGLLLRLAPLGAFVSAHKTVSDRRVDYRPGLEEQRMLAAFADEVVIASTIVPAAVQQIADIDVAKIRRGLQSRFLATHAHAATRVTAQARQDLGSLSHKWAGVVGCEEYVERFLSEGIRYRRRGLALKRLAHDLFSRVAE